MTVSFFKATGSGAVDETFAPNFVVRILQIKFTLSDPGVASENLTCDIDAVAGAEYDGRVLNEPMGGAETLIKGYEPPVFLDKGDNLNFSYENSGSATWGLEVAFERVS